MLLVRASSISAPLAVTGSCPLANGNHVPSGPLASAGLARVTAMSPSALIEPSQYQPSAKSRSTAAGMPVDAARVTHGGTLAHSALFRAGDAANAGAVSSTAAMNARARRISSSHPTA